MHSQRVSAAAHKPFPSDIDEARRVSERERANQSKRRCTCVPIESQARRVTIDAIQKAVAEQFGLRANEIKAKSNSRAIVFPRQIAMYMAKQMTEASLPEIGRQFGGKHHTTVMHSIDKIEEQRQADKDLNRMLNKLTETLNN